MKRIQPNLARAAGVLLPAARKVTQDLEQENGRAAITRLYLSVFEGGKDIKPPSSAQASRQLSSPIF